MSERGSAKAWVLAFVLTAGIGLGAFIGIGCLVGANTCPGSSKPELASTDGRTLYVEASCAACHGIDGTGGAGPSLVSGSGGELTIDELVVRISNGRRLGGMPKFEGVLTEEQIKAVAAYVLTLRVES